jgi:putative membrane protein insertion efficiency factor
MTVAQHILVCCLRAYKAVISPVFTVLFVPLGFGCRFTPTCSEYALEAVRRHGAWRGSGLALRRLCRCQPWGGSGPDPVPEDRTPTPPPSLHFSRHGS